MYMYQEPRQRWRWYVQLFTLLESSIRVGKDLVYKGFIVYTLLIHLVLHSPSELPPETPETTSTQEPLV